MSMAEMLAVSEAQRGYILRLTLPDLEPAGFVRCGVSPGRLAACGDLFCADRSESAVYRLCGRALELAGAFPVAPETESLAAHGERLFVLSGGANSLQTLNARTGELLGSAAMGVYPRALSLFPDGRTLAVACGTDCRVALADAETLSLRGSWPVGGIACGVTLFAGLLYALCAEGEYDLRTIVGYIDERGAFHPQIALPGLPGAMAACGGGLLVGHLGNLTMLDAPNCRIRWQAKTRGLPTQLVPFNRFAVFADETDGQVGLIDLRRGRIYRRAQCDCPAGLAVI